MNNQLAAVTLAALEKMENIVLASANNALSFTGVIGKTNYAFKDLSEAELIDQNGKPFDIESLKAALSVEINSRVDSGKWS